MLVAIGVSQPQNDGFKFISEYVVSKFQARLSERYSLYLGTVVAGRSSEPFATRRLSFVDERYVFSWRDWCFSRVLFPLLFTLLYMYIYTLSRLHRMSVTTKLWYIHWGKKQESPKAGEGE